jgi:hypothetical protein
MTGKGLQILFPTIELYRKTKEQELETKTKSYREEE